MAAAALLLGVALAAPRADTLSRLEAPLRQAAGEVRKGMRPFLIDALPEVADATHVTVTLEVAADAMPHPWTEVGRARVSPEVTWVQVRVPWDMLASLDGTPGLLRARLPHLAREKSRGEVVSEGLQDIFQDGDWQDEGIDGRRVDVIVVDVGFAGSKELVDELPRRTTGLTEEETGTSAHGTAVAEVIGDIAPRARLQLEPVTTGVGFLELMESLPDRRTPEIVNTSIGFDNVWPADGTSPYTEAVDRLADAGMVWVGAAGNEGGRYLAGDVTFNDSAIQVAGQPGTWVPVVDDTVEVSLRWTEPMRGASVDLDLVAYDEDGEECGRADDPQDGGDSSPTETLVARCPGARAWVRIEPGSREIDPSGLTAWLYSRRGVEPSVVQDGIGVLTLPADARSGLAVGACDRFEAVVPDYSSWGPTDDGRTKPDLCAPDFVSTGTYGPLGFAGTSAAAPHVTGFAALLAQSEGLRGEPEALAATLLAHTVDLGTKGPDADFGEGALDAGPPPTGCHCDASSRTVPPESGLLLLSAGLMVLRRRSGGFRRRSRLAMRFLRPH